MRLGSCVAIELSLAAAITAGLGAATLAVTRVIADLAADADAAARITAPMVVEPPGELEPLSPDYGVFGGIRDDVLLAPLGTGTIERVRVNRGGSSISLRIDLSNGARAAFKPAQTNRQSIPRKEVAAFRINRLLGLSSVPPACGRAFFAEAIYAALSPSSLVYLPRLETEMIVGDDGRVAGEMSWWIPEIDRAVIAGYPIDDPSGIVVWTRYLTAGEAIPLADRAFSAQISNMVVFDFLINNPDRWSGGNANMSPDGRVLYFMDNTMSFSPDPDGHSRTRAFLYRAQKFSRQLVAALRSLTRERIRAAMAHDVAPFEVLLTEDEIDGVMARQKLALAHIDELIATHGEGAVLVFP